MKNFAAPLLGLAVMTGSTFAASAQTASEIELTRPEIQTARQAIIAEGMKLTDEEALAFWPVYRDYRVEMARLGYRIVKVITEFAASDATLTDEQAKRLLDESLDIKADEVAIKKKYVGAFQKVLPAQKTTRFFQLANKLDAAVNFELAQAIPLTR